MRWTVWLVWLAILLVPAAARATSFDIVSEITPKPGVRIQKLAVHSPTANAWVVYTDLCATGVHVDATAKTSTLHTAGSWASSAGAAVATNGDFYKTGPLRVYGAAVGGGSAWPAVQTGTDSAYANEWYYQHYGWIAFGPNWVEFDHSEWVKKHPADYPIREGWRPTEVTHAIPKGTLALVSGFPELVVEGKVVKCTSPTASSCFPDRSDMRDRNPRTAMGLTEDHKTFILLVVDGRTAASAGLYGSELAQLMGALGAWEAFNIDGGGSSQLWVTGKGYLNDTDGNSGGVGTRAVANHWGIFGGTSAAPAHCIDNLVEGVLNGPAHQAGGTTDFDGDGTADACIRGVDGLHCASGAAAPSGGDKPLVPLADSSGWDDLSNAATVRMGDIDGDGRADVCARADAGIRCWTSADGPLATEIVGPELSDAHGWSKVQYYATIRLADVNGDGLDDLCARAAAGLICWPSKGDGFDAAIATDVFSDDAGFASLDKAATLQFGDIDGDGKADVCARGPTGMVCRRSDGTSFDEVIEAPAWADEGGWTKALYWSTIRLVDVDGDGRADLCARTAGDFRCHLSTGTGFGPQVALTALSNEEGFDDPASYSTIRMGDIDGDGDADLCARHEGRFDCWPWTGEGFGDPIQGPPLADADGWLVSRLYASPRLADVNGDGKADLCVRDDTGLRCFSGGSDGFPAQRSGPVWSGIGWESASVWGTLAVAGPRCVPEAELCNGRDDDCNGVVDDGCMPGEGSGGGSAAAVGSVESVPAGDDSGIDGSCAVRAPGEGGGDASFARAATALAWLALGMFARKRRGRRSIAPTRDSSYQRSGSPAWLATPSRRSAPGVCSAPRRSRASTPRASRRS